MPYMCGNGSCKISGSCEVTYARVVFILGKFYATVRITKDINTGVYCEDIVTKKAYFSPLGSIAYTQFIDKKEALNPLKVEP